MGKNSDKEEGSGEDSKKDTEHMSGDGTTLNNDLNKDKFQEDE